MIEDIRELIPEFDKSLTFETSDDYKAYLKSQKDMLISNVKEKLGITIEDISAALSTKLIDKAEILSRDLLNIAPHGDFSKLLENEDLMADFLKTEAAKPEHWDLQGLETESTNDKLIKFTFANTAVDEGEVIFGIAFVGKSGKLRHTTIRSND